MLPPAVTGSGVSVLVAARSADAVTVVKAGALLLFGSGSLVVVVAVAVLLIVEPLATLAPTWTTMVKLGVAPAATVGLAKVTMPVPPTAGDEVLQPAGAVSETKVVPAGMV